MESSMNQESSPEDKSTKMVQGLFMNLKLNDDEKETETNESKEEFIQEEDDSEEDDDTEEEFSFSLAYDEANTSPITADDAFANGQIKPIFPLFNQDLLLKEGMVMEELIDNDRLPNVKKVFVEADTLPATASTSGNGDVTGSYYYEWENKAVVEVAPDGCKKSNSTGFSKIWRFRDLMHRSSSDGRDAFVFLNNNNTSSSSSGTTIISSKNKQETAVIKAEKKKKTTTTVAESTVNNGVKTKVNPAGEKSTSIKAKKLVKSKTTVASAHEVYLRSKAKEQERRRSYLPYRPGVVGFFTNITGGGLTKNVHPY